MDKKEVNPYATSLDQGNAYWMARLAKEVYTAVSDDNDAPNENKILESLQSDDKKFRSVTSANKNSAQAALIEHESYLCMAFRGTDELDDWLDNINVFREDVLFGEFHRGFWKSVEDVWQIMNGKYIELREREKRPLFLTGHSLGGAMATIAAARFIHQDRPFTSVYTFGQPRAMNRSTARIYNSEAGTRHHRFQNNEDIVTRVPTRITGYSHVGECCYIDNEGTIHRGSGFWFKFLDTVEGAYDSIKDKNSLALIGDHDMKNYLNAVENWKLKTD